MRIRTVKPEFWEDEVIGTLSRDARLLFVATFNLADDEGLLRWTPAFVKAQVFMYDDDLSVADAQRLMSELTEAGILFPYHGGKTQQRLAYIVNFRRHQKINRPQPSKLPPPSLQSRDVQLMYGRRDGFVCHLCNGPVAQQPTTDERLTLSMDHVEAQHGGGSDYPSNIRAAHLTCNKSRRHKSVDDHVNGSLNHALNSAYEASAEFTPGRERKGKEGKGREQEEETSSPATPPMPTPTGFDAFWDEYPRRVGKQAAIKAWTKAVKHTTPAALLDGALRLAQDPNREDQFTPHPATWLNEGRWEDDPLPDRTQTARARPSTTDAGIAAIQAMKHPQRLEIA